MSSYQEHFKKKQSLSAKRLEKMKIKKMPSRSSSLWMILVASTLAGGSLWYLCGGEERAADMFSRVEISLFGQAIAEDAPSAEKPADPKLKSEEKTAPDSKAEVSATKPVQKNWTEEEITLFKTLEVRKKQLDSKETELSKLEEELQRQKEEIEKKLESLTEVRTKISAKLEDKVKVDGQKVDTLVAVYAVMKPVKAAAILETLNEDLAVEILAKMKNKSAAEILNVMTPEKSKKISERFAGFREPAAQTN